MKKSIKAEGFLMAMFLCSFCKGQYPVFNNLDSFHTVKPFGINSGYNPTGILDTVKTVLLISDCDSCHVRTLFGFAVMENYSYSGDRMPPGNYDDFWSLKIYLDTNRKPFPPSVTIWDYRLKEPKKNIR